MDLEGLVICPATIKDVPDVVRLLHEDSLGGRLERFQDPLPSSYYQAFQKIDADENNELLVADLDGEVVGTFQMTFVTYMVSLRQHCLAPPPPICHPWYRPVELPGRYE